MFDDIIKKKKKGPILPSHEEVIKAMEYNIKKKQEIIDDLIKRITDLERKLENKNQDI